MQVSNSVETEKTFVDRTADWGENDVGAHIDDNGVRVNENADDAAPAPRPAAGETRLGSGIITELIARGGMAAVYKVWNERIELFRAVKLLERAGLGARFETETMITAKLRHPSIVEIYDAGEWNGHPYMEMEYVDGENLQQALNRRGRFPEAVCLAAAIRIAEALRYAHTLKFTLNGKPYSGIIHRDLKPANIMISRQGEIKLTDFGVARPAQASLHTLDGNIVGTLHYISPEQMEGNAVDHRSDIFSLGAILYEMATGVKTFPQQTITELVKQRNANSFKMPGEHGFPLNAALSNVIVRCLRYNPKKRYPDAANLLEELRKAYSQLSDAAPPDLLSEYFSGVKNHADNHRKTEFWGGEENHADNRPSAADILKRTSANTTSRVSKFLSAHKKLFMRKKLSADRKTPVNKNSYTSMIFIILLTALAVFSLSYTTVRLTAAPARPHKTSFNSMIASEAKNRNITSTPNEFAAPKPEAPPPNTGAAASAPKSEPAPPKTVRPPRPAPAADKPELDLLREAAGALSKKQWDTAIKILEPSDAYKERHDVRTLLLLEAYVESRRFDDAQAVMSSAAQTGDAHYFLSAGKLRYYKGDHNRALELFESSMTRPSISKYRNVIFCDALYYIAEIRQEQYKAAPSEPNRTAALDGWRKVQSAACGSKPGSPRFERAEKEIAGITGD